MKRYKNFKNHRKPSKLERFYKSDRWHLTRAIVITRANGLCERCGKVGTEVHHIIHLTIDNVDNVSISINPKNLILLCKDCHNKEHHRFGKFKEYSFDSDENLIKTEEKRGKV